MGTKQTGAYCNFCQSSVLAVGTKPNHLLHLFLSIFTLGVWVLVWILVTAGNAGGYRCTRCGNVV